MRTSKSRQEILHQNRQILSNIAQSNTEARRNRIRAKGHILFADAKAEGFKKVGWDVYQRPADIDHGHIWSVEEIEGDRWLVCYTDANDHILRNLATDAADYLKMKKVAHEITEPVVGYALKPGDLVEITPRQSQSINYKFSGMRGVVSAAMPDRSELKFDDGSTMWVENKDLVTVTDQKELQVGDAVRMFSKNVSGKITKISNDGRYISFKNDATGQEFAARKEDVVKKALVFFHSDPNSDAETKVIKELMRNVYQPGDPGNSPGAKAPEMEQPAAGPLNMGPKPDLSPTKVEPKPNPSPIGGGDPDRKAPPSIKQLPSLQELEAGSAIPASNFASDLRILKVGRRMNLGDRVQRKSTGQQGTIVDIRFDRKLGKFYLIDFGQAQPEQIFETDLMKVKGEGVPTEQTAFPMDVTPGPHRMARKKAVLDARYDTLKTAALEFVSGMMSQALLNHETEYPGKKPTPELENALAKQAVSTFMSKYLPPEYRQIMGSEDKDEFSEWLLFETAGEKENAPTVQDFTPEMNEQPMNVHERALAKVHNHLNDHVKIAIYSPAKFASPTERNRFVHQATFQLQTAGMEQTIAHYIAQNIVSQGSINNPLLKHTLVKYFAYEPHVVNQLIDTAEYQLANSVFSTTKGMKFALDLPGMETLRGGGGGYAGGLNIDPMKWEVKNPQSPETDNSSLENALSEQLADQSKPFEQAAPKLDIKLDTENKQIIIDYNQEEGPVMPLEGAEGPMDQGGQQGMKPSPTGPTSPQGMKPTPGGNEGAGDFSKMDIPVNF